MPIIPLKVVARLLRGIAAWGAVCACASPLFAQAPVAAAPVAVPQGPVNPAQAVNATANGQPTLCGQPVPPPVNLPPTNIGPVLYQIGPCFQKQGGASAVEPPTYLYYMQSANQLSLPSQNIWKPFNEQTEQIILDDFKRLWATGFLDDLSIDVADYHFANGVIGKLVTYDMEERPRIKNVTYVSADTGQPYSNDGLDRTKIEETLQEQTIKIRLDTFVDPATEAKVASAVREMLVDKGFQDAKVEPVIEPLPTGPKLVNLTFKITEGPKVKISKVDFVGNTVFSDGALKKRMKQNKGGGFWIFPGSGVYQEAKFEEDADRMTQFLRERGYIESNIGEPTLKKIKDSKDGKTRYMTLEIPVSEGRRFKVGEISFDGNAKIKEEALRPLFKMQPGDYYNEKRVREGFEKSKEIYGTFGFFEMTPYPELTPTDPNLSKDEPNPVVNVKLKYTEGKQYYINRITFTGNTTTRDNVIRRELRLYENGVFNTEALKFSIRRLNQLGYFKPIEDQKNVTTEKSKDPGKDNMVDLNFKVEEQNRNQLSFGAGVSQYDGVFGQLSFSTQNFMGRGESLTTSVQTGARAHDYEVAFTEPFLFDRPITGSVDLHKRDIHYINYYTQQSVGGNITAGWPLANFTRMFMDYSYDRVKVKDLSQAFFDPTCTLDPLSLIVTTCQTVDINNLTPEQLQALQGNPFLYDSLLIGKGGRRTIGKFTPTVALNSVDNPVTPVTGRRYTFSTAFAGLGGDTRYIKPSGEAVWFLQQNRRISLGLRAQAEYIRPYGQREGTTNSLPIFEKLVLGGGYSVRGYDLRTIGPTDPSGRVVIGGNKSMLFNAEYLINIAGPVRLILFYDAGQVKDTGERFTSKGFITSTGAEIRFFMPVLNVPFRLIFAENPQRGDCSGYNSGIIGTCVLNQSTLTPEKKFRFRFDVGSTF
ncbi:MAG TPA: outer membrane protein assembly factor BamA [Vicinamibacterales bacterium]|nr:outer membrane protein assembly factor BamA [Vicinamibacterales bacterium]